MQRDDARFSIIDMYHADCSGYKTYPCKDLTLNKFFLSHQCNSCKKTCRTDDLIPNSISFELAISNTKYRKCCDDENGFVCRCKSVVILSVLVSSIYRKNAVHYFKNNEDRLLHIPYCIDDRKRRAGECYVPADEFCEI